MIVWGPITEDLWALQLLILVGLGWGLRICISSISQKMLLQLYPMAPTSQSQSRGPPSLLLSTFCRAPCSICSPSETFLPAGLLVEDHYHEALNPWNTNAEQSLSTVFHLPNVNITLCFFSESASGEMLGGDELQETPCGVLRHWQSWGSGKKGSWVRQKGSM